MTPGEVQRDEEHRQHERDADDDQELEDEVVVVRGVVERRARPRGRTTPSARRCAASRRVRRSSPRRTAGSPRARKPDGVADLLAREPGHDERPDLPHPDRRRDQQADRERHPQLAGRSADVTVLNISSTLRGVARGLGDDADRLGDQVDAPQSVMKKATTMPTMSASGGDHEPLAQLDQMLAERHALVTPRLVRILDARRSRRGHERLGLGVCGSARVCADGSAGVTTSTGGRDRRRRVGRRRACPRPSSPSSRP